MINIFKKYQSDEKIEKIQYLDEPSFREVEKALYEAREYGQDLYKDSLNKDNARWESEVKKDRNNVYKKMRYPTVEIVILEEIKKRYGKFEENLAIIDAFMKAKIISISPGYDDFGYRVILKVQPEETLKCRVPFMLQPEFEVYYRYYGYVDPADDFKEGKSYMLPIWYRPDKDISETKYSVATFVDDHGSRFLVENGIMHDKYNAFNLGENVDWKVFADTVKTKISNIINQEKK